MARPKKRGLRASQAFSFPAPAWVWGWACQGWCCRWQLVRLMSSLNCWANRLCSCHRTALMRQKQSSQIMRCCSKSARHYLTKSTSLSRSWLFARLSTSYSIVTMSCWKSRPFTRALKHEVSKRATLRDSWRSLAVIKLSKSWRNWSTSAWKRSLIQSASKPPCSNSWRFTYPSR